MKPFLSGMLFWAAICVASAQQIMVDQGGEFSGLWCFPVYGDSATYLYLPSRARLGLSGDSLPEFSFLRYVTEKPGNAPSGTITEAGGGGIVTFLILYDTPEAQIREAEKELREKTGNRKAILRGPVIFIRGRYLLVSSILMPDGNTKKEVLGAGEAPVLENSRLAFSFEVDPVRSKLLLESFKMKTPDISLIFQLGFSGLTDSYEAKLDIDWSEMRHSQSFGAGGSAYFISADIELGFDELIRNNTIRLTTVGTNESMESLLNMVYSKLLDLMFKPVEPEKVPEAKKGGLLDALGAIAGGALSSRKLAKVGFNVAFQMKHLQMSGQSTLYFHGRSTVERNHFISFNIGDLYRKYGQNERIFRDVALYDPAFQQREVYVGVDGSLEKEFNRMVNNVTVRLRKKHADGAITMKEVLINRSVFTDSTGRFRMVYLNRGDTDMIKWLDYDYQTVWKFVGGGTFISEWTHSNAAMINLYAPFQRRIIALEGDFALLSQQDIRAVSVRIEYPFFSEIKKDDRTIRAGDNLNEKSFEVTLPLGREEVDYSITWLRRDGTKVSVGGKDQIGLLFIDELPKN
ncbi:MAG TPA: hypothetical protein PLO67_13035 [Saprospiraceae bacterium]|nr:hypothetical protein [Saprospiraceae bacterium]HPI06780.1 hypothetical protein [Saprospiraceae bacterium]